MTEYSIIITSTNDGNLALNRYEEMLESVHQFVEDRPVFLIQDKNDYSKIKEFRTATNKALKAIKEGRIQVKEELLELFETQCKTLENLLDEHQKALGEAVKLYDEQNGKVKPKPITATLKFYDAKVLDKLKTFAEKNGCELTIKQ